MLQQPKRRENCSLAYPRVCAERVCVPVEHVNKRGWKGMWSQPPKIKNISVCVCAGTEGHGSEEAKKIFELNHKRAEKMMAVL